MSEPSRSGLGLRRRALATLSVAGSLLAVGGTLYVFRGCSSSDVETSRATAASAAPGAAGPVSTIEIPKFGQPEQARRYFDAAIAGDRRSIELIERALAEAKGGARVDPTYVVELERQRKDRVARLEANQKARSALGAADPARGH